MCEHEELKDNGGEKVTNRRKFLKTGLAGMSANLCVESHLRELLEQGFEVAVVKDATAAAKLPEGDGYTVVRRAGRSGARADLEGVNLQEPGYERVPLPAGYGCGVSRQTNLDRWQPDLRDRSIQWWQIRVVYCENV